MKKIFTLILLLISFQVFASEYTDIKYKYIIPDEYVLLVMKNASKYHIPVYILTGLIWHESKWNFLALNHNNNGSIDAGIMQLNSVNYDEFKWRFNNNKDMDWFKVEQNIVIGCKYLQWIYNNKKLGNYSWYKTIVRWNGNKKSSKILAKSVLE